MKRALAGPGRTQAEPQPISAIIAPYSPWGENAGTADRTLPESSARKLAPEGPSRLPSGERARRPAWHHRLEAEILPAARRFPAPEFNRVDVQTLFQIAERDAYRLLKRLGARAAGDALLVSRDVLIAR